MMSEPAITWPAGWGYVPGLPVGAPKLDRREPDRRYQRAFAFLMERPRWVAGRLPQSMVIQALSEKFKLRHADADAVIVDVRESIELGLRTEDFSPETARLPGTQRVTDEAIAFVMQDHERFRTMRRIDAAEELGRKFNICPSTAYSVLSVTLGKRA